MKRIAFFLLLSFSFFLSSCLTDPAALDNEPAVPTVHYDAASLTRLSVTVSGSFANRGAGIKEYGIQMAEGTPDNWRVIAQNLQLDEAGFFAYTVEGLKPGGVYYFRSYITNGLLTKYSAATDPVRTMPTTEAALSEVVLKDFVLSATILDDGGRDILEVGFKVGETPERTAILNGRTIPTTLNADRKSFSAPMIPVDLGKTVYIVAYAVSAEDASHTSAGYGETALPVTITDAFPAVIEDAAFATYLISHFDKNKDNSLSWAELGAIKAIDVNTDAIVSVGEIALMPDLQRLSCQGSSRGSGKLASLDISQNPKLTTLYCDNNALTELVPAGCPSLDTLSCANNQIAQLDLEDNGALRYLDVSGNPLTEIDICSCAKLRSLDARNCPSLHQVFVWMGFDKSRYPGFKIDDSAVYAPSPSAAVPFGDAAFQAYCVEHFDVNQNGEVSVKEAESVREISVSTDEIESLKGIEYFPGLQKLSCFGTETGGLLTSLDLSHNPELKVLDCHGNLLSTLDVSANSQLTELDCTDNPLSRILLGPDQTIASLRKPDASPVIYLINRLPLSPAELVLSKDEQATLTLSIDPEASVNEENIRAGILWESSNDRVATVTQEGVVTAMATGDCTITASYDGKVASCAVTVFIPVTKITLDPTELDLYAGGMKSITARIYPYNATDQTILWSSDNEAVATVSERGIVSGVGIGSCTITATVGEFSATCQVEVSGVLLSSTYFPDPMFRYYMTKAQVDKNRDGVLSEKEIAVVTQIDLAANGITSVQSLAGLAFFTALESLNCSDNQLTSLDVSQNLSLTSLICLNNPDLTEIWLAEGQTIATLEYDTETVTIRYK